MNWQIIKTQKQLDKALSGNGGWLDIQFRCSLTLSAGDWAVKGSATVEAWDNSTVRALGSATVEAWDNSTVRALGSATVRAWDNATVEAWDNSTVRALGNSTVRALDNATVEAWGNSTVRALGNSFVRALRSAKIAASASAAVMRHGKSVTVSGGQVLDAFAPSTALEWCEHNGVEIKGNEATLYKAVDEDFATDRSRRAEVFYKPGNVPEAFDWDGGEAECGGGLHACARPWIAKSFNERATRFVACPVRLEDIAVHENPDHPTKVKFRGCCGPVYEVDVDGKKLAEQA